MTDFQNGLTYDAVRVGLQPAWETRVPDGLDPCLPRDLLRTFTLATQNARFTKNSLRPDGANQTGLATGNGEPQSVDNTDGSNNWVIAPSKSATGRAILANDPHRAYSTPSLRYIVHVSAPGLNVIGAGEPALPGISIGHNGTIAFGLTIFNIDQEDLYVYELNPANLRQYRYKGGWEEMRVIGELVNVKGETPRNAELVFTRHGPVIHVDRERRRAYAVRSCWLEPGMAPYFGSVSYMRAKDFSEFRQAMLKWGAPTENQVYADVRGNIGWVPGGLAPIRPNWDGLLPVPGDGQYEWAGFWSGDKLPSTYNPRSGYVTTSNEMNLPAGYPYAERKLGFEWTNASRHARIDEVLKGLSRVTIEDSMRLQNDVTSIPARRLVALLAPLKSTESKTQAGLDLLRGWDAVERTESPQAALMEMWVARHLGRAFLEAVLPKRGADAVRVPDIAVMLDALENPTSRFSSDSQGTAVQKRDHVLLASLGASYTEVETLLGANAKAWRWGNLHHSVPEHPLAEIVDGDLHAKLQPGSVPTPGSPYTPNQSTYRSTDFRLINGPSFRMVLDVGNWDDSRAINYPGQSGNPEDAHYQDLVQMWLRGEYFPLLYTRSEVEKAAQRRIQMIPERRWR
jgi:penicillin amidase